MFLSTIPWLKLLKLALPFIREFFVGKFNFKGYFAKHPAITFCIIVVTASVMSMLFMTEQAVYHATKSIELRELLDAEKAKVKSLTIKKKDLGSVQCSPHTDPVQDTRKEVVLVPPAKPVHNRNVRVQLPVYVQPVPPKKPVKREEIVALPAPTYPSLRDKLHALDEDK